MKRIALISLVVSLTFSLALGQGIRKPAWSGQFYDKDPARLSAEIDSYLKNVKPDLPVSKEILALIVPHAGYNFSAQTAAYAYNLVQGKNYESVVIIGPSHQIGFEGCSIYPQGGFETPLGTAQVDEPLASALMRASGFRYVSEAHSKEHSVEVQVPFIQKVLPRAKIVPIVMGYQTQETMMTLARALAEVLAGKNVLVVASTDMSHFLGKDEANKVDSKTIALVESLNTGSLMRKIESRENILCGGGPVCSTLLYVQKRGQAKVAVLNYSDSTLAGGPSDRVVGYMSAALFHDDSEKEFSLNKEEKRALLQLARAAVETYVREKKEPDYATQDSKFLSPKGAFVTLKKRGALRGCIGFTEPIFPLYKAIIAGAIYAAAEDPRFPPVSPEELGALDYEISVLTPLKKIDNPASVVVGKHGLVISMGDRKGLLLPQVPVENNWSREEFLEQTCLKAGLPTDSWKKGAELYVFEAIVFH